jgi:hypothetical protein
MVLLALAPPVFASNWFFVGKTAAGDSQFVDLNSVSLEDPALDVAVAWSSTELANPAGNVRSKSRLGKYDCRKRAFRSAGEIAYSGAHRDGNLVSDSMGHAGNSPFEPVSPASVADAELTLVCDYAHRIPSAPVNEKPSSVVSDTANLTVTSVEFGKGCCVGAKNVKRPTRVFTSADRNIFASVTVSTKNVGRSEFFALDLQWTYGARHDHVAHQIWNLRTDSDADKRFANGGWAPGSYIRTIEIGDILHWDRGNYHLDVVSNGQILKSFDFEVHE